MKDNIKQTSERSYWKFHIIFLFVCMFHNNVYAYDFIVEGICYNYINDYKELEVAYGVKYKGDVVIPEEVTYMDRKRKVTSIGANAFTNCEELNSITIPQSINKICDRAFYGCLRLTSVTIPDSVNYIGNKSFYGCIRLSSLIINSGSIIGDEAFYNCRLTSVNIPNGVTSIGKGSFKECRSLTAVTLSNSITDIGSEAFQNCHSLTSIIIPPKVKYIENQVFGGCEKLSSVVIQNGIKKIGIGAFYKCDNLKNITIPNSVDSIENGAFYGCKNMDSLTIGRNVKYIGKGAFYGGDISTIISLIEKPFKINGPMYEDSGTFNSNTYANATLKVPANTLKEYKKTQGWLHFCFIEEFGDEYSSETVKCSKPTISYHRGKLAFGCETEGVLFHSIISNADIKSYNSDIVDIDVTYNISVYASKDGYEDSDIEKATLCWIDVDPKTEGITNATQVRAIPVMVNNNDGVIFISGIDIGTDISVFSVMGQNVGSTKSIDNNVSLVTILKKGEIAIIKIGDKSVKYLMQ